ncbi:hypothetical protein BC332_11154 [Capsicum chinense]|nr:hypothetical protein BC332_11154 [Capsicum chinense]
MLKKIDFFLFKCKWFDLRKKTGMQEDKNFMSICVKRFWYEHDPFLLATQEKQVFYIDDPKLEKNWRIVLKFQSRHIYDVPEKENSDVENNELPVTNAEVYQDTSLESKSIVNDTVDIWSHLHRDDVDSITIDANINELEAQTEYEVKVDYNGEDYDQEDDTMVEYISDHEENKGTFEALGNSAICATSIFFYHLSKVIAAYLLAILGGNTSPADKNLKKILATGNAYNCLAKILNPCGHRYEKGVLIVAGKSKSESKAKEKKHKKHKDKDKEHKKLKHHHKDRSKEKDKEKKKDRTGHHDSSAGLSSGWRTWRNMARPFGYFAASARDAVGSAQLTVGTTNNLMNNTDLEYRNGKLIISSNSLSGGLTSRMEELVNRTLLKERKAKVYNII